MAKQSKFEKAIAQIDSEIEVLQAVRKRLTDQQTTVEKKRAPKKRHAVEVVSAA